MRYISARTLLRSLVLSMAATFSAAADCSPPAAGLVGLWKGDGDASDSIGSNHASLLGHAGFANGKVGQAFNLDGTDSGVRLPNADAYHLQNLTIEAWVKRSGTGYPSKASFFGAIMGGGPGNFSLVMLNDGKLTFSKVGVDRIDSSGAINDLQWHHVAVTKNGSAVSFYIDGLPAGSGVYDATFSFASQLTIGALSQSTAGVGIEPFFGLIDEVSLYSRPLTASEISAVVAAGTAGKCVDAPSAVSLAVVNPSFEALTGTDPAHFDANGKLLPGHLSEFPGFPIDPAGFFSANAIPGWNGHDSSGTVNYLGGRYITNGLSGQNCIYINVTGQVSQTLTDRFQAGQMYRLSADVGYAVGINYPGFFIGLYANGQAVAVATNSVNVVAGSLTTATVEVSLPAGSAFIGAPIEIRLGIPGTKPDQTVFDNVRLTAQPLQPTHGVSLAVANPSFEALNGTNADYFDKDGHLLDGHFSAYGLASGVGFNTPDAVPGWTIHNTAGSAGTFNTQDSLFPGGIPDGQNTAWLNVVGYFSQEVTNVFQIGRHYQLTVNVGAPSGVIFPGYFVGLYANGKAVAGTTNSPVIPSGGFLPVTVSYDVAGDSPAAGAPIEIRIGIPGSSNGQVDFDAVRLTAESLGENLKLSASAPVAVQPGTDFTATFVVLNAGTQPATNVVLNTTLPTGFTLVTNTVSQGTNVVGDTSVQSALGIVEAGTAVTVTLTGHGGVATNLVFHGEVTREGSDLTLADNVADAGVEILGPCLTAPGGLALWLRGEGDPSDELSHASTFAGADYAAGKVGQAFSFDGTKEVVINDAPDLDQNSFTIETWVYPTSVDGAVDIIANKELVFPTTLLDTQFELGIKGPINDAPNQIPTGNLAFFLSGVSGLPNNYGGWVDAKATVPLNQWTHVALTVTPGTVTAYVNGALSFSATNLTGSPVVNSGPLRLGSRNPQYVNGVRPQDRFNGRIDEFSFYGRVLTAAEIASVYHAGGSGKCVQTVAASIVVPPTDVTVLAGHDATFGVVAVGTGPLTYQWKFKGENIVNATNSTLVVPAPRKTAAGAYSVTVCNAAGCTPPATANLTVTPAPAVVRIVNTVVQSPQTAVVPVQLVGNGVENALSFSVRFDTNRLTYLGVELGGDAPDAQILVNDAQAARGILAVILALPAGTTFADGTNDALHLTFGTPLVPADLQAQVALLNSPTVEKISDVNGTALPGTWVNGLVTISAAEYEGDVNPVPGGNRQLDISDWVQVGRYVAGLDDIGPGSSFQKADCAPLATAGNGVLSVSDWVQAGRFAVGLDALVGAGGPTGVIAGTPGRNRPVLQSTPNRVVSFGSAALVAGLLQEIPITITASGDENAVAFSVSYDPAVLKFVGAVKGSGSKNAVLNVNTRHTGSGEVGVAMALTTGAKFPAGTLEIARLQFTAITGGTASTNLAFTDAPVVREVASPLAETLSAAWQGSSFSVTLPNVKVRAVLSQNGPAIEASWPVAYAGAVLETSDSLGGSWTAVTVAPTVADGQNTVVLPLSSAAAYFHLKLP